MSVDLNTLTIVEAARRFRQRQLSPRELLEAHIARAAEGHELNALATPTIEAAREAADRAGDELASGRDRGALQGIAITLKENIDVAGVRTTAGSRLYADRVATNHSFVATRLVEAGAVLLGKANMDELALGSEMGNALFGQTRNPWDPTRIPGGSSGGSAVAVATGIGLASIGTDSGGSIRVPAALCGCVGLKPTYGRVSNAGIVPNYPSFDCVGPITRTPADAAIVLRAIAGYDPADFATVRSAVDDYPALLGGGVRGLRVGIPASFREHASGEVRAAFDAAIAVYRDLGAVFVDVEFTPFDVSTLKDAARPEVGMRYAEALRTHPEQIGDEVRSMLASAMATSVEDHLRSRRASERIAASIRRTLEDVDLLAVPTVPITAPRIGTRMIEFRGTSTHFDEVLMTNTRVFNFARVPALSHPCGFSSDGMPIGVQLIGRPFDEALLLRAAHTFEMATQHFASRVPAI